MWLIYPILTIIFWSVAEIFYKKGARDDEKYSHLKIDIFVGLVFGIHAILTILIGHVEYDPVNIIKYLPVSFCYIFSMACSYYGIRYIEESVAGPIEESSGATCAILLFLFFGERMHWISLIGVIFISVGVILLGILESKSDNPKVKKYGKKLTIIAFAMPITYMLFDAMGEVLDASYLDMATTNLVNVTEETIETIANLSYEFTFAILAIILYVFIRIRKEKLGIIGQQDKLLAAIFETVGQYFYVFAMSENPIISAPMISSVCVFAVILSRIFLKEKLSKKQYLAVTSVIIGIMLLGLAEGLSEAGIISVE